MAIYFFFFGKYFLMKSVFLAAWLASKNVMKGVHKWVILQNRYNMMTLTNYVDNSWLIVFSYKLEE